MHRLKLFVTFCNCPMFKETRACCHFVHTVPPIKFSSIQQLTGMANYHSQSYVVVVRTHENKINKINLERQRRETLACWHLSIYLRIYLRICMAIYVYSKWAPLSDALLWFLWIEFEVTGQLIGHASVRIQASNEKFASSVKCQLTKIWNGRSFLTGLFSCMLRIPGEIL